ncbi:hypothetical protein PIB30_081621, partial [Stylosanthes scabra]|nr:hypothetical protein [Stylosanthes scabra]
MEMQGIPVTMANLAIHRQREEEINQERMRSRVCENKSIKDALTKLTINTNTFMDETRANFKSQGESIRKLE